jgi:serine/threonine-protein kinase
MSVFATTSDEWTVVRDPTERAHCVVPLAETRKVRDDLPHMGSRLGPYRVCTEIGSGGMATVYLGKRASHNGLSQYVALKCIRNGYTEDPTYVEMFVHEAEIAARLEHPNVCRVLDFANCDGLHVLVLEYLAGETLKAIRDRVLDHDYYFDPRWHACLMARIVADAAEGLHAAHELRDRAGHALGVVHRDVCPSNVMVTWDGAVKVMDFGLARSAAQRHRTRTGLVKGKYAYIQPEVLRGLQADRRADVWSLGVVLWELLTGERLFDSETDAATLNAVANAPIPAPSAVHPALPPAIDAIVARALARDPAERFPNARELGRALMQFIGEEGRSVGLVDIAEFMDALFPAGPACTRQLLDLADQVERGSQAIDLDRSEMRAPTRPTRRRRLSIHRRARRPLLTAVSVGVAGLLVGGLAVHASGDGPFARASTEPVRPAMVAPKMPAKGVPVPDTPYVIQVEGKAEDPGELVLRLRRVDRSR